jgi:hypothetical protein
VAERDIFCQHGYNMCPVLGGAVARRSGFGVRSAQWAGHSSFFQAAGAEARADSAFIPIWIEG